MLPNSQYEYRNKDARNADNRSKSPKNDFFRSSLKSKQDLNFLRHREDNNNVYQTKNINNDFNARQTLNRPEHSKYISQTSKNQTKLYNNFFKNEQELKNRNHAVMGSNKSADKRLGNRQQYSPAHNDNRKNVSQNVKPQDNQYQRLHDKLNYLEVRIYEMRVNLQKRKEQKKKYFEKQMKERKQLLEVDTKILQNKQYNSTQEKPAKISQSLIKQMVTQVPHQKKLKPFTFDPYSPRHNIYYVSEIVRAYKQQNSLARQHLINSLHLLRIMSRTRVPTQVEVNKRMLKLNRKPQYQDKKTVILDLDETLIHCNQHSNVPSDVKLQIKLSTTETIEAGINIRPYAIQFLRNLSKNFEVIVFTASHSCYANVVLNYLDPENKYIAHRLFRDHCFHTSENVYIKDLRIINREMSNMVLVDNAAYSYAFQLDNGIPIIPFYQGKVDFELKALQTYLQSMILCKDVREINKNTFKLHRYLEFDTPEALVKQLYLHEDHR